MLYLQNPGHTLHLLPTLNWTQSHSTCLIATWVGNGFSIKQHSSVIAKYLGYLEGHMGSHATEGGKDKY